MRIKLSEREFYKMLTEIHNAVADNSCGCMGSNCTVDIVKYYDKHKFVRTVKTKGKPFPTAIYEPVIEPQDYIGNIIRKYIDIE